MSGLTIEFTDTLVVVTCWCGINHAVPENLRSLQLRQHRDGERVTTIFCPIGHQHSPAGKGEAERLREKLELERRAVTRVKAEKDQLEASLRATKGALTKAKRRAANGVCPCCHRTFKQLSAHMRSQHPGFVKEANT